MSDRLMPDLQVVSHVRSLTADDRQVIRACVFGAVAGWQRWQRTKDFPHDAPIEDIAKYLHAMHHEAMRYFTLELGKLSPESAK